MDLICLLMVVKQEVHLVEVAMEEVAAELVMMEMPLLGLEEEDTNLVVEEEKKEMEEMEVHGAVAVVLELIVIAIEEGMEVHMEEVEVMVVILQEEAMEELMEVAVAEEAIKHHAEQSGPVKREQG